MSGNYPDGVTGAEPQIAGSRDGGTRQVTCENTRAVFVPQYQVQSMVVEHDRLMRRLSSGEHVSEQIVAWTERFSRMISDSMRELECEWEGEADLDIWGVEAEWTCPRCGTTHAIDLEDEAREAEADRARDREIEGDLR